MTKTELIEAFSDGKRPTVADWQGFCDLIPQGYSDTAFQSTIALIRNLKQGSIIDNTIMQYLCYTAALKSNYMPFIANEANFGTGDIPTGANFEKLINALTYSLPGGGSLHGFSITNFTNQTVQQVQLSFKTRPYGGQGYIYSQTTSMGLDIFGSAGLNRLETKGAIYDMYSMFNSCIIDSNTFVTTVGIQSGVTYYINLYLLDKYTGTKIVDSPIQMFCTSTLYSGQIYKHYVSYRTINTFNSDQVI